MATQITITTPTFLPNSSEGIEIKARTKAGGNPFNDTLEMYFARQETMFEVLGMPTTQRNGVFIPTGRVNSEYDNMIYFIQIQRDNEYRTYNKVYFANISGYSNPLFTSTDYFYGQSTGRTKENTVMWLGSQWQYNRPSNWSINKEIIFSLSDSGTSWTVVNSRVIDTTPITGVEGDFLTDEKIIMGGYSLSSYRTYTGTSNRHSQSYVPVIISKYTGAKVAEVDSGGNYTGNIVDITGDIYIMANPYNLFTAVSTSYRSTEDGTKAFMNLFADVPDFIMKKEDIQVNGFVGSDYPSVQSLNLINRKAFINYMNTIGIPWTFEETVAVNGTIDQMTDYDPDFEYYDPYNPPGQPDDTTGGGDGTGDNTSDDFESSNGYNPLFPTSKQYVLDAQDVDIFQSYLWEPSAWQSIQELWGDAWGAIISLKYYPFSLIQHDGNSLGNKETIKIGKVSLSSIGNISQPAQGMPMLPNYNCRFDLGEFKFEEYYGTFMDYEPYTSISIFLPFIGWRDIGTNDVMGKVLKVHYIVDFNTGNCTAYLTINNGTNEFLYNQYQGTIGIDLPLSKNDFQQKMLSMGIGVMSASLTAAVQASGTKQTTTTSGTGESNVKGVSESRHFSRNLSGKLTGTKSVGDSFSNMARESKSTSETVTKTDPTLGMVNGFSGAMSNFVRPVTSTTTGTVGPSDSLWLSRKPIIRIERPIKSEASSFEENQGRPANITKKLGDLTGYVECLNPVLNFHCNESERTKISALLQGGIYL